MHNSHPCQHIWLHMVIVSCHFVFDFAAIKLLVLWLHKQQQNTLQSCYAVIALSVRLSCFTGWLHRHIKTSLECCSDHLDLACGAQGMITLLAQNCRQQDKVSYACSNS